MASAVADGGGGGSDVGAEASVTPPPPPPQLLPHTLHVPGEQNHHGSPCSQRFLTIAQQGGGTVVKSVLP